MTQHIQTPEERRVQAIDRALHQSGIITGQSIRRQIDDAIETAIHQMAHQKIHVADIQAARTYTDKFDYDVLDLEGGGFSIVTASAAGVWVVKVLPEKAGA